MFSSTDNDGNVERPPDINVMPSRTRSLGGHTRELEPVVDDPTRTGVREPRDRVEQRRLADAVAPDHGVHAPVGHPK